MWVRRFAEKMTYKMNNFAKGMLIVLVFLYIISPIDFCPGSPIDDIIVLLLGIAANIRLGDNT